MQLKEAEKIKDRARMAEACLRKNEKTGWEIVTKVLRAMECICCFETRPKVKVYQCTAGHLVRNHDSFIPVLSRVFYAYPFLKLNGFFFFLSLTDLRDVPQWFARSRVSRMHLKVHGRHQEPSG